MEVSGGTEEALKFGAALFVINLVLDAVIRRVLFMSENYFSFLSIWLSCLFSVMKSRATFEKSTSSDITQIFML